MECWNTGFEQRETNCSTKNLESTFFDDIRQTSIFCFQFHKVRDYSKNINAMVCALILFSLNASFHYPKIHYSTIPTFQLGRGLQLDNSQFPIQLSYDAYRLGLHPLIFTLEGGKLPSNLL